MSDHLSSSNCVLNRSWLRSITFTIMCVCACVCVKGWDTKSDRQRAICRTLTCDCELSAEVASLLQSSSLPCCCPDVTAVSHHRDLWLLHLRRAFFSPPSLIVVQTWNSCCSHTEGDVGSSSCPHCSFRPTVNLSDTRRNLGSLQQQQNCPQILLISHVFTLSFFFFFQSALASEVSTRLLCKDFLCCQDTYCWVALVLSD